MKIETVYWLTIIGMLAFSTGCQSGENPWQVEKYRSPEGAAPTLRSTYAPVPRILPTIEKRDFDSIGQSDDGSADELSRILSELEVAQETPQTDQ